MRLKSVLGGSSVLVAFNLVACGAGDTSRKSEPVDGGGEAGASAGGARATGGASTAGGATSAGGKAAGGGAGAGTGGSSVVDASVDAGDEDASSGPDAATCVVDGARCAGADGPGVCCDGACVAGDCCAPSDCGAGTDAGSAGFLCSAHQCIDVAGSLSGLLWELPCGADSGGTSCPTTPNTTVSTTLGGAAGVTYDVALRFRGVVEQKTYNTACGSGYFRTGGTPAGDTYNIYRLTISSPPQTFYLNAGTSSITNVYALDFEQTIRVNAGATVTLFADAIDSAEIRNVDASNVPISIAGVSPPQPYNGQFIQMDVQSVVPDPVATGSHVGGGTAGHALAFNGSQFATVADAASLQPASLTQEGWFQFAGATGIYNSVFGKAYGSGTEDSYTIWYQSPNFNAGAGVSSPSGAVTVPWSSTGEWHHVALTFDATTSVETLYIDGAVVSCNTGTTPRYDTHDVILGGDIDNGGYNGFWNGTLDELRLFSTARTASEVWADMHTHSLGATAGLVGEWTFDEGSGQTTADSSGSGNAAVLGTTSTAEATDPTWVTSTVP